MEMFVMNIIEQQSESLLVTDQGLGWTGAGRVPIIMRNPCPRLLQTT